MKVVIYVEGPSDKLAMEHLLRPLILGSQYKGVEITFHPAPSGDAKKSLLLKIPVKAVSILKNISDSIVIVIPDLYPINKGFQHSTFSELRDGIFKVFKSTLARKGMTDSTIINRFKIFCFKYDLEALVLAAQNALASRLGQKELKTTWQLPVEDQNHTNPPKLVVKELFMKFGQAYNPVVDAPVILGASEYREIAEKCPQCFKPLVDFLENLPEK